MELIVNNKVVKKDPSHLEIKQQILPLFDTSHLSVSIRKNEKERLEASWYNGVGLTVKLIRDGDNYFFDRAFLSIEKVVAIFDSFCKSEMELKTSPKWKKENENLVAINFLKKLPILSGFTLLFYTPISLLLYLIKFTGGKEIEFGGYFIGSFWGSIFLILLGIWSISIHSKFIFYPQEFRNDHYRVRSLHFIYASIALPFFGILLLLYNLWNLTS